MRKTSVLEPETIAREKTTDHSGHGYAAKTILFNDDDHTFDEVAAQLMKATRCSFSRGISLAGEVHATGSAVVYTGHLERCEAVASVLEEIHLRVKVER